MQDVMSLHKLQKYYLVPQFKRGDDAMSCTVTYISRVLRKPWKPCAQNPFEDLDQQGFVLP